MSNTKKMSEEEKKKLLDGVRKHSEKYLFGSKNVKSKNNKND